MRLGYKNKFVIYFDFVVKYEHVLTKCTIMIRSNGLPTGGE